MESVRVDPDAIRAKYVEAARDVRDEMARTAADVDKAGVYPEANMRLIEQSRLHELVLPRSAGGEASDDQGDDVATLVQVLKHLAAGESSTAQIWAFNRSQSVGLLGTHSPLQDEVKQHLIDRVKHDGVRFCSPQAERYKGRRFDYRMAVRPVTGGVVINGTKYFATGSAGATFGHCTGLMEGYESVFAGGGHDVLVDLTQDSVELHDDWDNMGQRATSSGAITFHDVFVPDGYHWPSVDGAFRSPNNTVGIFAQFGLTSVILGIGCGAMDALVKHLNERATFPGVFEDTATRYQLGVHAARLNAGEAALTAAAYRALAFKSGSTGEDRGAVSIAGIQAKVAIVDAVLGLCSDMQKFLGGQSTSNSYRYDRFWRNARTLSLQDVMDVKAQQSGSWVLNGEPPPISWVS